MAAEGPRGRARYRSIHRPDNPTEARRFGREPRDKTLPLAQHSELGRSRRPGLPDYVRELVVHRNYIVFHRALHEVRTVEILRVKHLAQQTP